jgi:hypothetical protein
MISSLDGVVEQPEGWSSPYLNEEVNAERGAGMAPAGTLLLGRRTYQDMISDWPHQGTGHAVRRLHEQLDQVRGVGHPGYP